MTICVVDGRGGGLGSRMVEGLRGVVADGHTIIGVGLNRVSAEAMARAGRQLSRRCRNRFVAGSMLRI